MNNRNIQGLIDELILENSSELIEQLTSTIKEIISRDFPSFQSSDFVLRTEESTGRIYIEFTFTGEVEKDNEIPAQMFLIYDSGDYSGNFQYNN